MKRKARWEVREELELQNRRIMRRGMTPQAAGVVVIKPELHNHFIHKEPLN